MSDGPTDCAKERKAKEFKQWDTDKMNHSPKVTENVTLCEREIEQRVLLNGLDILQGALWMLKREKMRHCKDIQRIEYDIMKLERMGIVLPPCLKLDLWFEIPNEDPRTGTGVK